MRLLTTILAALILVGPAPVAQSPDAADTIGYFVADGKGHGGYQPGDRELASWALAAWQRSAGPALRFEPVPENRALVRVYWADPEDGQYGEMVPFTTGDMRGAALYIRPDTSALGLDIARQTRADGLLRDTIVYLTCVHELGHALGLRHTREFADIMYSFQYGGDVVEYFGRYRRPLKSRADLASLSPLSPADVEHLRTIYAPRQALGPRWLAPSLTSLR